MFQILTSVLDTPINLYQFDKNCGKIQYVSDTYNKQA